MGIPSYFSYIVKNHPEIIQKYYNSSFIVSNFYLDCNSIIYDSYAKLDPSTLSENAGIQIINSVISKIEEYIQLIQPKQRIIIAFDGVAPLAKLKQQRERRFKSWFQSNTIDNLSLGIHSNSNQSHIWDKTAITPGTIFMKELNYRIRTHFATNFQIIVSGSDEVGEGEHKIFQYIRDHPEEHTEKFNTFIYGLDSDLIMLSINHLHCSPNIYLFRETPHFIQSISSDLEPNENYILDIPELSKNISYYMTNENSNMNINRTHDYILLCFLLGNDFLPHFPAINIRNGGIDKLLLAYKNTIGECNELLTNGKIIYWKNFKKLIFYLFNLENQYLIDEHGTRNKMENGQKYLLQIIENENETEEKRIEAKIKQFNSMPIYNRKFEKYINPFKPGWENRYYKSLFTNSYLPIYNKREIAINYIEGIEWTFKYYTTGEIDWTWKYKYNYPPLLQDLFKFMPNYQTTFINNINQCNMPEIIQLCYVLPKQSLHLLPPKLSQVLLSEFPDWYIDTTINYFMWAYCRYFWESHLITPELNIDKFIHIIQNNCSATRTSTILR
jgi:5'-3' exonuclease